MNQSEFNKLISNTEIKLTDLRKDVLAILLQKNKPMGAYEILEILRKKRPNAEPPTVYRVLDFLVEAKLAHRIDSQNTYVCCSHLEEQQESHSSLLLICKVCQLSYEYAGTSIVRAINKFAEKNGIYIDKELIEIKGICKQCLK